MQVDMSITSLITQTLQGLLKIFKSSLWFSEIQSTQGHTQYFGEVFLSRMFNGRGWK